MFLTTNRVGSLDVAFKSRIHLSLHYPPLDWRTTKKIWNMNLDRIEARRFNPIKFKRSTIIGFAATNFKNQPQPDPSKTESGTSQVIWNGRQIRNAFQTALALAESEAKKKRSAKTPEKAKKVRTILEPKHFKAVLDASHQFDQYMEELFRKTEAGRAKETGIRLDDFQAKGTSSSGLPYKRFAEKHNKSKKSTKKSKRNLAPKVVERSSSESSEDSESEESGSSSGSDDSQEESDTSSTTSESEEDESEDGTDESDSEEDSSEDEKSKKKKKKSKKADKPEKSEKEKSKERSKDAKDLPVEMLNVKNVEKDEGEKEKLQEDGATEKTKKKSKSKGKSSSGKKKEKS